MNSDFNQQWYFEETILHELYTRESLSTNDLESFFDNYHPQNINNVISHRESPTSMIFQGYMTYDKDKRIISITQKGIDYIEAKYSGRR